ncbi:MAG: Pycsar system effector family protein [Saprospiraceae bacterium]
MSKSDIVVQTEAFVTTLLNEKLNKHHKYHNLAHTLAVRDAALQLADVLALPAEEREVLELACLLHDTGFTETYTGHESLSHRIAKNFLTQQHYPEAQLEKVLRCIDITVPEAHPLNLTEQIIKDADYVNLAGENYLASTEALRHEWAHFLNQEYDDKEWYQVNYDFLKSHQYFTPAARQLYEPQKEENRKQLKKVVKKSKKTQVKTDETGIPMMSIADSRTAQMMFKTALRNHLDLSNLADNKANIMLSVNALIITVAIPLSSSYTQTVPYLVYPMGALIASCLVSMIFATLATRPIRMTGETPPEKIKSGESNLFFFGNFYSMDFKAYQEGMQQVISAEKDLDNAIMRDLFFLGRSLGTKYRQLRICYNIFMAGVVLTVLVFAVCYAIYGKN